MMLSDLMSKEITGEYEQVDTFMGKTKLSFGKHRKISIGTIALNFYCKDCNDYRTFCSSDNIVCIGVTDKLISIDCALKCSVCNSTVQMWFLIEFEGDMLSPAPKVKVVNKFEKLSENVFINNKYYGNFSALLEKADIAFRAGLGAGAIIYLRKILESVTTQMADTYGIEYQKHETGNPKNFSDLLEKVDNKCRIIPKEFTSERKRFFKELSGVVHGNSDEENALMKFDPLMRLTKGILDNIKQSKELTKAIAELGWSNGGDDIE